MAFRLEFTPRAVKDLKDLEVDLDKRSALKFKKVRKCLGHLETDPRHPGLLTHAYDSLRGQSGEKVFEAYGENNAPAAWRVFWHYGPAKGVLTIVAITSHP